MSQPDVQTAEPEQDALVAEKTPAEIAGPLEALLILAEEPVTEYALAESVDAPVDVVRQALAELVAFYDETGRGFELRHVGEGWRYYTRETHSEVVASHLVGGQQSRLSQAALETLAVIAYLQPISRSRVAAVRGVNVDGVMRTLITRELVREAGVDERTGAAVFATTGYFLEKMGLTSLDELPELAPHLPEVDELEAELQQLAVVRDEETVTDADPEPTATSDAEPPDDVPLAEQEPDRE